MTNSAQPRKTAFLIVKSVINESQTIDFAMTHSKELALLSPLDYQFVKMLVFAVLRHFGQGKKLLSPFLKKPLPKKRADIELILIMGIIQLYFLKMPAYAVINCSVELVKNSKEKALSPMVNGVLRAVDRAKAAILMPKSICNMPTWLIDELKKSYSNQQIADFADAFLQTPFLDITIKSDVAHWASLLNGTILPTNTIRKPYAGAIINEVGYNDGAWWVQEASASIPAQLLGDVKGQYIADLCAAPGGKTAQLLSMGATVDAYDISQNRLKRLSENLNRLNLAQNAHIFCQNALEIDKPAHYDAILLDAPCSATGTIRRHPEINFHRTLNDVERLADLQLALLTKAITLVKPGGKIVYATCSILERENEAIIQKALSTHPNLRRLPITIDRLTPFTTPTTAIQVLPTMAQDGFFATVLEKNIAYFPL